MSRILNSVILNFFVLDHLSRAFFLLLHFNIRTFSYVKGAAFLSVFSCVSMSLRPWLVETGLIPLRDQEVQLDWQTSGTINCLTTLHPTCDILICFANDARNICLPEILLLTLSASVSTSY